MGKDKDPFGDRFWRKRQQKGWSDGALPDEGDLPPPEPPEPLKKGDTPGRNDPCPCGSGKKYKQCCGRK